MKYFTLLAFYFAMSGTSYSKSKDEIISCMSRAAVDFQSLEDMQASFGEEEGEELFYASQDLLKNDLIKCIRGNSRNKCANKNLDLLIKQQGSKILPSDIMKTLRDCN